MDTRRRPPPTTSPPRGALAGPGDSAACFGRSRLKEVAGATQLHAQPVRRLDHLRLWTAASVTPTEQVERPARAAAVFEVADALGHFLGLEAAVVRVGGREVGEDAGPVDPLPYKGVVRGLVGVVPGELLGEEEIAAGFGDELRQVARIAEHVRQPED